MTKLLLPALGLVLLCGCSDTTPPTTSDSDMDAARNFLRASLNNDFDKAREYMLTDSANSQLLKVAADQRSRLSREENRHYQDATIRIYDTRKVNDSSSIIVYDNSYRQTRDSLLVFRSAGKWLVDLKYTYLSTPK
ncbi:DUF4878 domain-containing protein [Flaviaesturariibacter aridisoli]|uniref:Uncharacterized protein n=1 Tax=Flaviaesturariibacter aridisoli TaxID=2545761 RepID=A0A4V2WMA5_9BACT|nr:DUF4878 domain-containing protein [Flaviaesturariibacter aridisoli]TCZ67346.1 hypothetical protein E0486_15690 [Flaviaesturariibacter aridisoli]